MASENWQLTDDAATLYEKYVYPLMLPWIEALIDKGKLAKGEQVLDVACGTGFVARHAAKLVGPTGHVVGSDLNNGMIRAARALTPTTTDSPIEWHIADVIDLPFDNESFDIILCQQGMQFFPDSQAALKELYRILKPSGRLAFTIWGEIEENPYFLALADALENHLSDQAANGIRGIFSKSYKVDFEEALHDVGFTQLQVDSPILEFRLPPLVDYFFGHLASLPMAGAIAALPDSKQQALLTTVSEVLQQYTDASGLKMPSQSEIVSVVK